MTDFFDSGGLAPSGNEAAATRASNAAERVERFLDRAQKELAHLKFAQRALWELVKQKTDLTDDDMREMFERVYEAEMDAGAGQAIECTSCGRVVGRRQPKCLYCGTPRPRAGPI